MNAAHRYGLPDAAEIAMVLVGAFVPMASAWAVSRRHECPATKPRLQWHPLAHLIVMAAALTTSNVVVDLTRGRLMWFLIGLVASFFALTGLTAQTRSGAS